MSVTVYACENCGFLFSRVSECDQCPDCGKKLIRKANEDEIAEFKKRQKENF